MTSAPNLADTREWHPQVFGRRRARQIRDPVIEPLWIGERVLVHVAVDPVDIRDPAGERVDDDETEQIARAVRSSIRADTAVLDGYLTRQVDATPDPRALMGANPPTAAEMATQLLVGRGARRTELVDATPGVRIEGALVLVLVDLLAIDDEPLLDVPLLERKRLLDGALDEGELVRRTAFVRPPIDPWLGSWRALGFKSLAYKAANSRYLVSRPNDDWAIATIPQR